MKEAVYNLVREVVAAALEKSCEWLPEEALPVIKKAAGDVRSSRYNDSVCSMCDESFCDEDCPFYLVREP